MQWYYSAEGAAVGPHSADEIENLFVTLQITAEALVWRKGFAAWTPLGDTVEFAHLTAIAPPPLPHAPQHAARAAARGDVLVADRITGEVRRESDHAADDEADTAGDDGYSLEDDQHRAAGARGELDAATVAPVLAGPWTRYFARSIDLTIVFVLLLVGVYLVAWVASPALYQRLYSLSGSLALLLLPVALLLNAVIITLCGNSLGKAIFAIRAEPIAGDWRFGLGGNLKRELRVWVWGLALGLPILSFSP